MTYSLRSDVRTAFAALLTATGEYAAVYDYPKKNLEGKTPVALVLPGGVERRIISADVTETWFYVVVAHIVVRDDAGVCTTTLDSLENTLFNVVKSNYATAGTWTLCQYDQRSKVEMPKVDNNPYALESFLIAFKIDE